MLCMLTMLNHVADFCYTTQHTWFGHGDLHVWSIFGRALVLYIYIWWIGLFLVVFWAIEYLRGCMAWLHRKIWVCFPYFFLVGLFWFGIFEPKSCRNQSCARLTPPLPLLPLPAALGFWIGVLTCRHIMHPDLDASWFDHSRTDK